MNETSPASGTPPAASTSGTRSFLQIDIMRLPDVPVVGRLERLCFTAPWSENAYRHELTSNPRSFYFVLRSPPVRPGEEGAPGEGPVLPPLLAYGGYWLLGDEAHVVTIASHPAYRRKALGELMLLHLIGRAREAQVTAITLEVRPSNLPARALYAKWGFDEVGLRKHYYRDNNEDAILMTLHEVDRAEVWAPMAQRLASLLATLDERALDGAGSVG
jgi:ribosomal-protein-alanine N-acetyltransferase